MAVSFSTIDAHTVGITFLLAGHIDHSKIVMQVITWNRSFRGLENAGDVKDDFDSEENETHATVLDKLLAWERKLYDEVKVGAWWIGSSHSPLFNFHHPSGDVKFTDKPVSTRLGTYKENLQLLEVVTFPTPSFLGFLSVIWTFVLLVGR